MKFDIQKGDILWTLWAELFLLWKDYGNIQNQDDVDAWYAASKKLFDDYEKTEEKDLCLAVLLAMGDVIDARLLKKEKDNDK